MITLEVKYHPSSTEANAIANAAIVAALSQIKQVEKLVEDIRDPATGEGAKVSWDVNPDGILIRVRGTDFVCAEAERRISALKKPAGPL